MIITSYYIPFFFYSLTFSYCYLEFKDKSGVSKALLKDGEMLNGNPLKVMQKRKNIRRSELAALRGRGRGRGRGKTTYYAVIHYEIL